MFRERPALPSGRCLSHQVQPAPIPPLYFRLAGLLCRVVSSTGPTQISASQSLRGIKEIRVKYFHSLPVFFWDLTVAVPCIYGDCSEPG